MSNEKGRKQEKGPSEKAAIASALGPREMEMNKPHVLCIPVPTQGHINPMMQVAKLLHSRGFFITFVNTAFSHKCQLRSLECLDGFRFEIISDGLPEVVKDDETFFRSTRTNCVASFRDLLKKLQQSSDRPPLTYIVSDALLTFTLKIAEEMGIPDVLFCPTAACTFMASFHFRELMRRGLVPLKEESYISNGYLDTTVDWIPGMREMRLRDLGSFIRTTDPDDYFLNFLADEAQNDIQASAIIFNTFDDLEHDVLCAIRSMFTRVYTIGPLSLQCRQLPDNPLKSLKSSMLKEETECLKWLDNYKADSVIYMNFGSTTIMTAQQLLEFAWAIANSNHPFLWAIRPDLVKNGGTNLPQDFMNEIEGRGMLVNWSPQEEVLSHHSIAVFLTHCGWNSTLESISFGVPMLCWPYFGDQPVNCRYACNEWSMGIEINNNAKREEIGAGIEEFMRGDKGKELRKKAMNWKESAEIATKKGGSSHVNLESLISELSQTKK